MDPRLPSFFFDADPTFYLFFVTSLRIPVSYGQDWSVVVSHGQEVKSWWPEEYESAGGRCQGVLCVSIPLLAIRWFLKIHAS